MGFPKSRGKGDGSGGASRDRRAPTSGDGSRWHGGRRGGKCKPEPIDPSVFIGEAITQIKPGIRDPSRVTIKAGRRVVGTVDAVSAHRLKVKVGREIDEALAAAIAAAVFQDRLRSLALRRVARSMCSVKGLADALVRKGADRETAARIAADFERLGLVNDEAFANAKARSILARKPAGARLIQSKLRAAGVDAARSKAAASGVLEGRDALEDAVALAQRRARGIAPGVEPEAARRRVFGALARRGFEMDVARRAVEAVLGKPGRGARR
jgi:regulatory protein